MEGECLIVSPWTYKLQPHYLCPVRLAITCYGNYMTTTEMLLTKSNHISRYHRSNLVSHKRRSKSRDDFSIDIMFVVLVAAPQSSPGIQNLQCTSQTALVSDADKSPSYTNIPRFFGSLGGVVRAGCEMGSGTSTDCIAKIRKGLLNTSEMLFAIFNHYYTAFYSTWS